MDQKDLIDYFFDNLDYQQVKQFCDTILNCDGIIFLTGMGKSGIIAKNIGQMLVSIGVCAMFLDPVNALHGDVGVLNPKDILILFSKSGQTSELLHLVPSARNKDVYLIAIISDITGLLVDQCQSYVKLPLLRELCPFDLAPTTSSIIQLVFGNTAVAYLMEKKGLTKEAYARNHPAGRIGKRLTVKVVDVMRIKDKIAISEPQEKLINQISNMSSKKCGNILIEENYKLVGIFTDGDLRRNIEIYGKETIDKTLRELMTLHPNVTTKNTMAYEAMNQMEDETNGKKRVKELPVVDVDGRIEGLVMLHDLVQFGL